MADVFISYAHEDQAFVRRMVPALEAEGFSVWWDHTIPPGKTWNTYIARGIEEAKACIVVWSQHSVASKWVMEEATLANDAEKLLPVSIDRSPPPMGFRAMQAAQLQGWKGDAQIAQWRLLVHEARQLVGARAGAHPEPPLGQRRGPRGKALANYDRRCHRGCRSYWTGRIRPHRIGANGDRNAGGGNRGGYALERTGQGNADGRRATGGGNESGPASARRDR